MMGKLTYYARIVTQTLLTHQWIGCLALRASLKVASSAQRHLTMEVYSIATNVEVPPGYELQRIMLSLLVVRPTPGARIVCSYQPS